MIYKDLDAKFSAVHNFIMIQIVLTLVLIAVVAVIGGENRTDTEKTQLQLKNISRKLEIFQDSVPYDPARKKRIEDEKTGNFNEFEKGVL